MKRYLSLARFLPVVVLSACASYHDDRAPEVQKANLENSLNGLYGDYLIKDSRNDQNKFNAVKISPAGKFVAVEFTNEKGEAFALNGFNCTGYYKDQGKSISLFCDTASSVTKTFFIDKLDAAKNVTDGAVIGGSV